jgi:peptidoglycan/xylan/chitin deacetylase (PgdA/CDA1 family)
MGFKMRKYDSLYFVMTVDVDPPPPSAPNLKLEEGAHMLLQIFKEYGVKSTFFVPATMAEKFPDLMQKIRKNNHEIACHDLDHSPLVCKLGITELIRRIKMATQLIEASSGVRPIGYRAPLFKISQNQWTALYKNEYLYDSSVVCSPFFGYPKIFFPSRPFYISVDRNAHLMELPVSINPIIPLPIGGGYLRIFGEKWAIIGVKANSLFKSPVIFYIHPKDIVFRKSGPHWYSYKNTLNCATFLIKVIQYAKKINATFIRAIDLVNLHLENSNNYCNKIL